MTFTHVYGEMMSDGTAKHAYAIKMAGKTLGVKDVEQLRRLLAAGRITATERVYELAGRRWLRVDSLLAQGEAPRQDAAAFTALVNELATLHETMPKGMAATAEPTLAEAAPDRQQPMPALRLREARIAARMPNPEGGFARQSLTAAALALALGLVVGFYAFGAFGEATPAKTDKPGPVRILQAELKDGADGSALDPEGAKN